MADQPIVLAYLMMADLELFSLCGDLHKKLVDLICSQLSKTYYNVFVLFDSSIRDRYARRRYGRTFSVDENHP